MNNHKMERFAHAYVNFAERHKWKLFALIIVFFLASLIPIATRLKINPDLASLLPKGTASVLALEESYDRFGSTDRFMIAIQSSDPYVVAEIQDSVKAYIIAHWKEDVVTPPQVANDNQFFVDKALLYLPVADLERIRDNLEDIQMEIGRKHGPLVVDLLGSLADESEEKKERIWFDENLPQALGLPDEASSAFNSFFNKKDEEPKAVSNKVPSDLSTRLIGVDGDNPSLFNGVVQCKLIKPSTDIEFVTHVLARTDTIIERFSSRKYAAPVLMTVEGSYEGLSEVNDLMSDGFISGIISILLIYLIVAFFFRSAIRAPILMLSQVLLACSFAMCFTALYYGSLNPFTVLVASIILGMGVDYSIHFLGNCQRYFTETGDLKKALEDTIAHLTRPMMLAAVTTVAGLLSLLIAKFVGFYEFGVISAVGISMSFLTAIFVMPVLTFVAGGLPPRARVSVFPEKWTDLRIERFFKKAALVGLIFSILMIGFLPHLEFEHNFRNLRRPSREDVTEKKRISTTVAQASNRKSSTPAVAMASSPELLDSLYDTLMVRLHQEKDPTLRSFLTLKTFLPKKEDQEERMEIVEEISDLIDARVFDKATGQDSVQIKTLRNLVATASLFTLDSLPEWAMDLLREKDGSIGKIGFIYGYYPSWDAYESGKWQDRYGHWDFGGEKLKVFSSQFIFSDVIRAVKHDAFRMAFVVIFIIILILIVSLRNLRLILTSSASLLIGFLWSAGLLGVLSYTIGVGHIGIYNVVVIPAVLGLAIDSTIHLIVGWMQTKGITPRQLVDNIGRLVMASSITTAAGFAGALGISHKGLRTIGELAVTSILAFLFSSLIYTVFFCIVFLKKKD